MEKKIKNQNGITLISLVITVIVILILAGVGINASTGMNGDVTKTKSVSDYADLVKVQQAALQAYISYKQTGNVDVLKGKAMTYAEAKAIETEFKALDSTVSLKQADSAEAGNKYYRLSMYDLRALGLNNLRAGVEYVVNYATGEVFNATSKQTGLGETLYVASNNSNTDYIKSGLVLWYDGINNTGNGHSSSTTTWKDLSGNGNHGTINGISTTPTATSGWGENYLAFDGTNDWVSIGEMNLDNFTLEVVVLNPEIITTGEQMYICNFETGGYGLCYNKGTQYPNTLQVRISASANTSSYIKVTSSDTQGPLTNVKYSLSGSFNGSQMVLFENGNKNVVNVSGVIKPPSGNTVLAVGVNPYANRRQQGELKGYIYSVRVYNRALTDEEVAHNYAIDKARFGIED